MEKLNIINKKKVAICIVIGVLVVFLIICSILSSKDCKGINAIVTEEKVKLYSKPTLNEKKIKLEIEPNTEVKILKTFIKDNMEWYKVKLEKENGYILSNYVDYFDKEISDKTIVADFSSHNFKNTFNSKKDIESFLVRYNISYVYIRAGGRGYGKEGNFYTDEKYREFKNACEYLGIQYGYYFLDESLTNVEIISEVEYIDNFMKKNSSNLCTLPVALDIEEHEGKGRCDNIWETRAKLVANLIEKINKKGYKSIIYSNANTCNKYLYYLDTKFWLAYYPEEDFIPDYWYDKTSQPAVSNMELINKMIGWQFTENGVEHVIKEDVDLSIFKY